jgi:hypothetical protein
MVQYSANNLVQPHYANWASVWPHDVSVANTSGYHDFQLHKEYPSIEPFFMQYEKEWTDGVYWTRTSRIFANAAIIASVTYVILVFGGARLMKNRKPFDLKAPLAIWNLILSVFSIIGTIRLIPHLVYGLAINDSSYFFCRQAYAAYGAGAPGLWVNLFIWSKYFELIDTAFLVLRKKPVSFLHWFHHATVLMYCWDASQYQMPTGIFFATFNYLVHAIMYTYYFIAAVTKPPKWGMFVTVLQIVQMFAGMFVTAYHYYLKSTVPNCDGSYHNLAAAFVMYTAYNALFVQFFVGRYLKKKTSKKQREEPAGNSSTRTSSRLAAKKSN